MSNEEAKYKVLSRLINGESTSSIAQSNDIDVTYATIIRWSRELKAAQENNTVAELMKFDAHAMNELTRIVAEQTPLELVEDATNTVTQIATHLKALDALQTSLVATAMQLNKRILTLSCTLEHASEINELTESLCKLQNAFFNKALTQVNVQNNYGANDGGAYGKYLSD